MLFCFFFFFTRFSQFFVAPLVKMEAMEREVLAVDSGVCYTFPMYFLAFEKFRFHISVIPPFSLLPRFSLLLNIKLNVKQIGS